MSMKRNFQHAHLLTTRTVIYEPPDLLTQKLPILTSIFETLDCAFKTEMSNMRVVYFADCIVLVRLNTSRHLLAYAAKVEKKLQATVSIQ